MRAPRPGKPRGVLSPRPGGRRFRHARYPPSGDLAFFVEHYWSVRWDLRGEGPRLAETLPHPCVHLVVEEGRSGIVGVVRGKFSRPLAGEGRVFGVKFRPGGFRPFWGSPVSGLTDRRLGLRGAFGAEGAALEQAILALGDDGARVGVAEDFLRRRLPERDANVEAVARIAGLIAADRGVTRVEDVAARSGMGKRTLQRLFCRYVGVGPKWVIKRYRLHEAAGRLAGDGEAPSPAELALELGYFDQAHFAKDFEGVVGAAPAGYARRARSTPAGG